MSPGAETMRKIAIVLALAVAAGWLWARCDTEQSPTRTTTPMPSAPTLEHEAPKQTTTGQRAIPRIVVAPQRYVVPKPKYTFEPTGTEPRHRALQEGFSALLKAFRADAKLNDWQWAAFRSDLVDLAEIEADAWEKSESITDFGDLNSELGRELVGRAEAYMTPVQVSKLRMQSPSYLISTARMLFLPPT